MLSGSTWLIFLFHSVLSQILIELETALLDDIPHWYKLQTHDVSSIPLPQPSPYLPRRHVHGDSPSKKLQSMFAYMQYLYTLIYVCVCVCDLIPVLWTFSVCASVWSLTFALLSFLFCVSQCGRLTTEPLNLTLSSVCVCMCVCTCAGSHRIIDTEFDDGLMVVTKGGWGAWLLSTSW